MVKGYGTNKGCMLRASMQIRQYFLINIPMVTAAFTAALQCRQ